jgi:hypothetical protein
MFPQASHSRSWMSLTFRRIAPFAQHAITKDRLRDERASVLAAQDIMFQRVLEASGDTSAIVAEKQRLRDITNLVDGCTTLDELKGLSCQL